MTTEDARAQGGLSFEDRGAVLALKVGPARTRSRNVVTTVEHFMGGPSFQFWYGDFTNVMVSELAELLARLSRRERWIDNLHGKLRHERLFDVEVAVDARRAFGSEAAQPTRGTIESAGVSSSTICIHVQRWRDDHYPAPLRPAFVRELGSLPVFELAGCCLGKDDIDYDALREIAARAATAFGGWIVERAYEPALPTIPLGASLVDGTVREVVGGTDRYWLFDARCTPSQWVQK